MSTFKEDFKAETGFEWRPWRWTSKALGILLLLMAVSALISVTVWVIGVATSDTAGHGEAIKQKNSAANRTQAQAQFHATFESVRSLDQRLTDAQAQLNAFNKTHPSIGNGTPFDPTAEQQGNLQRTVTGLQQQCRIAVADYSASTETYTLRDFRDSDLPYKIAAEDPLFTGNSPHGHATFSDFDCQPNG